MKDKLEAIRHNLLTQDSLATAHPVFIVQQRRRIYGFDTFYVDDTVWFFDGEEYDGNDLSKDEKDEATLTGYMDVWEFVTACFTRKGCEDYLAANGHNLKEPRIYVESAHRNEEWQTVRSALTKGEL